MVTKNDKAMIVRNYYVIADSQYDFNKLFLFWKSIDNQTKLVPVLPLSNDRLILLFEKY